MSAPVQTCASLPVSAATDAALRVAAWRLLEYQDSVCLDPKCDCHAPKFLPDRNRDDLARVFAAAREHPNNGAFGPEQERVWFDAVDQPRAALCALLDLLSVPVPQEVLQ